MIHHKKINLFFAFLLSFNLLQSSVLSSIDSSQSASLMFTSPSTAYVVHGVRIGWTLLAFGMYAYICDMSSQNQADTSIPVTDEFLYAKEWYAAMAKKYPEAHLDDKKFKISYDWESTYNEIYFPLCVVQNLNIIYKKKLEGELMNADEEMFLQQQEFFLLHEAGHIEHRDLTARLIAPVLIYACMEVIYTCMTRDAWNNHAMTWINDYIDTKFDFDQGGMLMLKTLAFGFYLNWISGVTRDVILGLFFKYFVRDQELKADNFALEQGDVATLRGGVNIFEFIDQVDLVAQDPSHPEYDIARFLIAHPWLRWVQDFWFDPDHPGPSVRARILQDEIDRRVSQEVDVCGEECI